MPVYEFPSSRGSDDTGNLPPMPPSDMESRLAKLEAALPQLQADVAVIRSNYATKEDLAREIGSLRAEVHKSINDQTWKLITWTTGLGAGMVAITFWLARTIH